jgi:hypothetical protein
MAYREEDLSLSDDNLLTSTDLSDIQQSTTTSGQLNNRILHIHCLSETRTLKDNGYTSSGGY